MSGPSEESARPRAAWRDAVRTLVLPTMVFFATAFVAIVIVGYADRSTHLHSEDIAYALVLALSGLTAALVFTLVHRRNRLDRKVRERTAELLTINERLQREVRERERAEGELRRLARVHALLADVAEGIVRTTSADELLAHTCRTILEHGAADAAVLCLADGERLVPTAAAGPGAELFERLPIEEAELGQLRAGRVVVCDPTRGGRPPRCAGLQGAGFPSAVVLPLRDRDRFVGVLQLLSRAEDGFRLAELGLFQELASELVTALGRLEGEARRRQSEASLRKLSRAIEQSASAVMITDTDGHIEYVNSRFTRLTGWEAEECLGETPRILRSKQTPTETHRRLWETVKRGFEWHGELLNRTKGGELYWCFVSISPLKDEEGRVTHFVAVTEDISDRKAAESQIRHLAFHDPLTQLPNRRLFRDRLAQALLVAHREREGLAVLTFDLDRFKAVNDLHGHQGGDELLKQVADRIRPELGAGDTLARLGGDEFALVRPSIERPEEAAKLATAILARLSPPFVLDGQEHYAGASCGITLFPGDGATPDELLRNADLALYLAKDEGGGLFRFFTAEQDASTRKKLTLEHALRRGITRGELLLHFQPQVELATGRIAGVEALVRWAHPELGLVSPADFVPLAEETGLIGQLGAWVLQSACRAAVKWPLSRGISPIVAVNVSARQLREPDFPAIVRAALAESGLPPGRLELELTESAVLERPAEGLQRLRELHALGIRLSIDDFGTGVSSLARLKELPFHALKIDRSFVRDVVLDPGDRAIVQAVVALGHSLGLEVLAEGVETEGQLQYFRDIGGDLVQGYLVSRPLIAAELERFLLRTGTGRAESPLPS